ncbi:peptidase dimerization domain-containing protein, partial [Streptomyces fradiae]|uniref:peptidase dimerization domain-containing protein n=1 Tax=Streptomyces fradiae TaxID=1906 RepID=UPI0036A341A6
VLHGRGGHAATPHLAVDPVVAAAAVVMRLQAVVARETAPADQVTVTVGTLHAGTAPNVIPDRAELGVGVRASSEASLDRALAAVRRVVRAESAAAGAPRDPEVTVVSRSAALRCDPDATAPVRRAHEQLLGAARVLTWPGSMAAEDFALFGDAGAELHGHRGVPLVYWMLGVTGPEEWRGGGARPRPPPPAPPAPVKRPHVSGALRPAVAALAAAALDRLTTPAPVPASTSAPASTSGPAPSAHP